MTVSRPRPPQLTETPRHMPLYGRVFARWYDPLLARGEARGMRAIRRRVLSAATGRTLEIGAGTGLNLPLYPPAVTSLTLTEPDGPMMGRLRRRAERQDRPVTIVQAPADRLPVADHSIDTVMCTLVLCTVADVPATLREIRRVLAPGGRLLVIEHVQARDARTQRWQHRLYRPWRALGYGCHCDRDTMTALSWAGFDTSALQHEQWQGMPRIVRPLITGSAAVVSAPP
jgi:ubiquinone/menaquinone biosynthesis C-methylase UbiE